MFLKDNHRETTICELTSFGLLRTTLVLFQQNYYATNRSKSEEYACEGITYCIISSTNINKLEFTSM